MKRVLRSQAGFSLIELMVVVAIIGILSAVAIPNFTRFQAKARQSEAKANLGGIFSAEKAFFAEWTSYFSAFEAIGYAPEGNLRYLYGTDGSVAAAAPVGFTAPTSSSTDSIGFCVTNVAANRSTCVDNSGAATTDMTSTGSSSTTAFVMHAVSKNIGGNTTADDWTIDNTNTLAQTANGI